MGPAATAGPAERAGNRGAGGAVLKWRSAAMTLNLRTPITRLLMAGNALTPVSVRARPARAVARRAGFGLPYSTRINVVRFPGVRLLSALSALAAAPASTRVRPAFAVARRVDSRLRCSN